MIMRRAFFFVVNKRNLLSSVIALCLCGCSPPEGRLIPMQPLGHDLDISSDKLNHEEESDLLATIHSATDFISLFETRQTLLNENKGTAAIWAAMERRAADLSELAPPMEIDKSIYLVAFRWESTGFNPHNQIRYTASWLFFLRGPIEISGNESLRLHLIGTPKRDHTHLLYKIEKSISPRKNVVGTHPLIPSEKTWETGTFQLIAAPYLSPAIPLRMETFFLLKNNESNKIVGQYGRRLDLGWYIDFPPSATNETAVHN